MNTSNQTLKDVLAPPKPSFGSVLKQRLFNTPLDAVITIICAGLLFYLLYNVIDWAFLSSIWKAEDEPLCRDATGACW